MPQYILRPDGVIGNAWTLNGGAASAADALNGTAIQPAAGETTKNISTTAASAVSEVTVGTVALVSETVSSIVVWSYCQSDITSGGHSFQAYTGASPLGSATSVADGSAVGWRSSTYNGSLSQAALDDLRIRITNGAGGIAQCFAYEAYIEVNTTAIPGDPSARNQVSGRSRGVTQPSVHSVR